jgi:3-methyladenine DNA glycosylase Mpg
MPHETIATSPRIGISRAKDVHRRYFIVDNPYVSK